MDSTLHKPVIPLGHCPLCQDERVLYGHWDERAHVLQRRCTVCESVVDPGHQPVEFLAAVDLEFTPFEATGALSLEGGCGGGCSSGGCATCDQVDTCAKVH